MKNVWKLLKQQGSPHTFRSKNHKKKEHKKIKKEKKKTRARTDLVIVR